MARIGLDRGRFGGVWAADGGLAAEWRDL